MTVSTYNALSLGAKNSTVAEFKQLVDNSLGIISEATAKTNNNNNKLAAKATAELTVNLYDSAMQLPESKTITFEYATNADKKFGYFKGGNTFKSYNGLIDATKAAQYGWIITDSTTNDYCLFTNNKQSFIIAIHDFTPKAVVSDLVPLYNKLKNKNNKSLLENLYDDIHTSLSLVSTFKRDVSLLLTERKYKMWQIYMNAYRMVNEFKLLTKKKISDDKNLYASISESALLNPLTEIEHSIYPQQINKNITQTTDNDLVGYREVQAVIYDQPYGTSADISKSSTRLYCYQQPDNISYTSAAQFDSVAPRGAQQPFQFYQGANQITLSFSLKFHADEVATIMHADNTEYTLQDIAKIAEDFTRPWATNSSDNNDNNSDSIKPKLVKVILPGISEIGYMEQATITYSGDMTGNSMGVMDSVMNNQSINIMPSAPTNYFYNQLEISFQLIVLKDVELKTRPSTEAEKTADSSSYMRINTEGNTVNSPYAPQLTNKTIAIDVTKDLDEINPNLVSLTKAYYSWNDIKNKVNPIADSVTTIAELTTNLMNAATSFFEA